MSFLNHQEEYTPTMMREKILIKLNQWIETQRPDVDWIADPQYSRLPPRFTEFQADNALSRMMYHPFDVFILQEAVWMRDISRTVARTDRSMGYLDEWLDGLTDRLEREEASRVRLAAQLFDWTVRNIQLDAARDEPSDEKSFAPRPGGKYYPAELLLLGHGDWLELSRLFILLARQQNIPVVMLGIEDDTTNTARPWCPAAWIGGELYLFDMYLGLPLPGTDGKGIATLREIMEHPELLQQLDVEPEHRYPVRGHELKHLSVLIDATPEALSQRMHILEAHLTSTDAMTLTTSPSLLWQELRQHPGLARQSLLTSPYEAYRLRGRVGQAAAQGNRDAAVFATEFGLEMRPFEDLNDLLKGLMVMFRGEYEDGVDTPGAKTYLGAVRQPDALIDNLATSEQAQLELQVYNVLFTPKIDPQTNQPEIDLNTMKPVMVRIANFDAVVSLLQLVLRELKQHASYRLGVLELEAQRYASAESWLQTRTIEPFPQCRWIRHAGYNLARVYEESGQSEKDIEKILKAVSWYESDGPGPRMHGCRIRANRIRASLTLP
ncbi:MAG: hypothetical protein O3C60_10115 [Planctomycetota bacterium]|nr:hypothetical protein [Planctomycetota bacterium]